MITHILQSLLRVVMISLLFIATQANAQSVDPEWPCVQVLVPNVVTAVFWPNVIDESLLGQWKNDQTVSSLARDLGDLVDFNDETRARIGKFAESIPENERHRQLDLLADGTVTVTNRLRRKYIQGIKRYTRQQISIAEQVEQSLNLLAQLENSGGNDAQITEVKETLDWHERVYDQREQAIRSLCEAPIELEEKLSLVLREMAQYLP